MDVKDNLQSLLNELGLKLGIADLALDEDAYCTLVFDGRTVVNLQADANAGTVILFSELRQVPENRSDIYPSLLEANLFWKGTGGATLAIEPETRCVVLQYQESLIGMDFVRFEQVLDRFVNAAEQWAARLAELVGDTALPETKAAGASDEPTAIRV